MLQKLQKKLKEFQNVANIVVKSAKVTKVSKKVADNCRSNKNWEKLQKDATRCKNM